MHPDSAKILVRVKEEDQVTSKRTHHVCAIAGTLQGLGLVDNVPHPTALVLITRSCVVVWRRRMVAAGLAPLTWVVAAIPETGRRPKPNRSLSPIVNNPPPGKVISRRRCDETTPTNLLTTNSLSVSGIYER